MTCMKTQRDRTTWSTDVIVRSSPGAMAEAVRTFHVIHHQCGKAFISVAEKERCARLRGWLM